MNCQSKVSKSLRNLTRNDLHKLSLLHDSLHNKLYAGKTTHAERNCLAGLATKKSGGTITHLHTCRQDGCHNTFPLNIFLDYTEICSKNAVRLIM